MTIILNQIHIQPSLLLSVHLHSLTSATVMSKTDKDTGTMVECIDMPGKKKGMLSIQCTYSMLPVTKSCKNL